MSGRRWFGTDGIRGRVGTEPMTAEFVLRLGWAAGCVLGGEQGGREVLIGKDTRISGYMFESALEAGLAAAGVDTLLVGPMPTPAIAYLTRTFRQAAGVVISASHNPHHDNGIKFFSSAGMKLPDALEARIEQQLEQPMTMVDSARLGRARRVEDARGRYIEFCKGSVPFGLSLDGLKLVVDSANGAAYKVAPRVFRELGADVVEIGSEPDGININEHCGATSVESLSAAVVAEQADAGIALDGDGDRVIMIDHAGRRVDGDALLLIVSLARQESGSLGGGVVGTLMSNLGLEQALEHNGIPFVRSAVGDRYVLERLQQHGWKLGGESSGHIVCLDRTTTGDGIVSALQVLACMVETGQRLQALAAQMTRYPQLLVNVRVAERVDPHSDEAVRATVAAVEQELGDSGRVLLRASGTEPLVRVMVEGPDEAAIRAHAERIAESVRAAFCREAQSGP